LKNDNTPGCDGIHNEHTKYGGAQLLVYMHLLFNAMIMTWHSFVPSYFCFGMTLPLLKDKHGDASKLDMYRGITLSNCASNLFEHVLVVLYGDSLQSNEAYKTAAVVMPSLPLIKQSSIL